MFDGEGRKADTVDVDFDRADYRQTLDEDTGSHTVEANRLEPANDERVTVRRTRKLELPGGLSGSNFTATTRHRITFKVK